MGVAVEDVKVQKEKAAYNDIENDPKQDLVLHHNVSLVSG